MTLPCSTDYDRPHYAYETCAECGNDAEGGWVGNNWICNWCYDIHDYNEPMTDEPEEDIEPQKTHDNEH